MKVEKLEKIYKKDKEKAYEIACEIICPNEDYNLVDFDFLSQLSFKNDWIFYFSPGINKTYLLARLHCATWFYLANHYNRLNANAKNFCKSLDKNTLIEYFSNPNRYFRQAEIDHNLLLMFKNGTFNVTKEEFYKMLKPFMLKCFNIDDILDLDEKLLSDELIYSCFASQSNEEFIYNDIKKLYEKFKHRLTPEFFNEMSGRDYIKSIFIGKIASSTEEEITEIYNKSLEETKPDFNTAMYLKDKCPYLPVEPLFNCLMNCNFDNNEKLYIEFLKYCFANLNIEQERTILNKAVYEFENIFVKSNKSEINRFVKKYVMSSRLTDAEKKNMIYALAINEYNDKKSGFAHRDNLM